jgi:peptidoglycan/xylan/chitin deacetylase (PgdA/CDA1 family)
VLPLIPRHRLSPGRKDIYSYGDSAGFSPVFPFNGAKGANHDRRESTAFLCPTPAGYKNCCNQSRMRIDHFYEYWPIIDRPDIEWPEGKRLAVYIALNIEHFEPGKPSVGILDKAAGRDPDPANEGWRDYGNRVGLWRITDLLDRHGIRPSVLLNSDVCKYYPRIIDEGTRRNWSWVANGRNNSIAPGNKAPQMRLEEERHYVNDVLTTIQMATGKSCKGWLGPLGLGQNYDTLDLLVEEGITYSLDWSGDDQPFPLKTFHGEIISVPYSLEINDLTQFINRSITGPEFGQMIMDQFDVLQRDSRRISRVMSIGVHPFILGQPHRFKYFEQALAYLARQKEVWFTTSDEIAAWYMLNYYHTHVRKLREAEMVQRL